MILLFPFEQALQILVACKTVFLPPYQEKDDIHEMLDFYHLSYFAQSQIRFDESAVMLSLVQNISILQKLEKY